MLFELRRYELRPGTRADWVELFETAVMPFQVAKGIVVVGSFTAENEPDVFFWIRRFDSEEERVRLYEAVYKDPEWISAIKPRVDQVLIRETMQVTRLIPTPRSVLR